MADVSLPLQSPRIRAPGGRNRLFPVRGQRFVPYREPTDLSLISPIIFGATQALGTLKAEQDEKQAHRDEHDNYLASLRSARAFATSAADGDMSRVPPPTQETLEAYTGNLRLDQRTHEPRLPPDLEEKRERLAAASRAGLVSPVDNAMLEGLSGRYRGDLAASRGITALENQIQTMSTWDTETRGPKLDMATAVSVGWSQIEEVLKGDQEAMDAAARSYHAAAWSIYGEVKKGLGESRTRALVDTQFIPAMHEKLNTGLAPLEAPIIEFASGEDARAQFMPGPAPSIPLLIEERKQSLADLISGEIETLHKRGVKIPAREAFSEMAESYIRSLEFSDGDDEDELQEKIDSAMEVLAMVKVDGVRMDKDVQRFQRIEALADRVTGRTIGRRSTKSEHDKIVAEAGSEAIARLYETRSDEDPSDNLADDKFAVGLYNQAIEEAIARKGLDPKGDEANDIRFRANMAWSEHQKAALLGTKNPALEQSLLEHADRQGVESAEVQLNELYKTGSLPFDAKRRLETAFATMRDAKQYTREGTIAGDTFARLNDIGAVIDKMNVSDSMKLELREEWKSDVSQARRLAEAAAQGAGPDAADKQKAVDEAMRAFLPGIVDRHKAVIKESEERLASFIGGSGLATPEEEEELRQSVGALAAQPAINRRRETNRPSVVAGQLSEFTRSSLDSFLLDASSLNQKHNKTDDPDLTRGIKQKALEIHRRHQLKNVKTVAEGQFTDRASEYTRLMDKAKESMRQELTDWMTQERRSVQVTAAADGTNLTSQAMVSAGREADEPNIRRASEGLASGISARLSKNLQSRGIDDLASLMKAHQFGKGIAKARRVWGQKILIMMNHNLEAEKAGRPARYTQQDLYETMGVGGLLTLKDVESGIYSGLNLKPMSILYIRSKKDLEDLEQDNGRMKDLADAFNIKYSGGPADSSEPEMQMFFRSQLRLLAAYGGEGVFSQEAVQQQASELESSQEDPFRGPLGRLWERINPNTRASEPMTPEEAGTFQHILNQQFPGKEDMIREFLGIRLTGPSQTTYQEMVNDLYAKYGLKAPRQD